MVGGKIVISGILEEVMPTFSIDSVKPKVKIDEVESAEVLQEKVFNAEHWIENNPKLVGGVIGAILLVVGGVFASRMCEILERTGAKLTRIDIPWGTAPDPEAVDDAIRAAYAPGARRDLVQRRPGLGLRPWLWCPRSGHNFANARSGAPTTLWS
mgnify:CR=1 FL=1